MSFEIENGVLIEYIEEDGETSVTISDAVKEYKVGVLLDIAKALQK